MKNNRYYIGKRKKEAICLGIALLCGALLTGFLLVQRGMLVEARARRAGQELSREVLRFHVLADSDGQDRVVLYAAAEKSVKRLPAGQTVDADRDLIVKLEKSFGEGNVKVVEKRIENIRRMQ